ncbi:MAG: MBL fold metallo-hydrolase [Bacteroidales bacterium]
MKKWKTKNGYEIIRVLSGRCNVFIVSNGINNLMVDASVSRLWAKLQKQIVKLSLKNIDCLILTHAHFDHAANANKVKEKYKIPVIIHKNEAGYLTAGENILPNGTTFFTKPLMKFVGKKLSPKFNYEPCIPDLLLDEIYDLKEFGIKACLIHTPGHTTGSMSLIVDDEIALVGDAMFGVFSGSVFPPFANDVALMVESWGKLLETKCNIFLPSHGREINRLLLQREYKKWKERIQDNFLDISK